MKRIYTFILLILVIILSGNLSICFAQLPSQGRWNATTINATTSPGTKNPIIELSGNIDLRGAITINSGYTLTIRNISDSEIIIQKNFSNSSLFVVKGGGTLIVEGASDSKRIIMDCGANFTWEDYSLIAGDGSRGTTDGINNSGTLSLTYVTIRNFKNSASYHGAINVTPTNGTTTLNYCTIEKCLSGAGCAIMIQKGSATDPETCKVSVSNSLITRCISGNSGTKNSGGAVRTLGNVISSLYLTNVTFSYNCAKRNPNFDNTLEKCGNGGALFWNGRGKESTTCYIDGCTFTNNKCDDNGGAIKAQGSIIFRNNLTTISNNTAPYGAGIFIEGYTGSVTIGKPCRLTYDLNQYLAVTYNTAVSYVHENITYPGKGAGIHFDFGSDMKLDKGSTIDVTLQGANITGNTVEGENGLGGGIFYEDTSPAANGYTFNINMNYGSITDNSSSGEGGGIYVSKGNVSSTSVGSKSLTVSGNSASKGAGIYIKDGGLTMANGIIRSNTVSGSGNGGGIYIENGDFTIDAGEVSGNTLASGQGAGVYIVGSEGKGNFTMNGGSIMQNTTSGNNGGGVYINGGNFTLNSGSITGNSAEEGGGVYLNNGNFSLVTGEISGNTASGNGGGVYLVGEDCEYRLKNGTITGNQGENGGGVYLANGSFILADSVQDIGSISGNTASGYGGGVYIAGDGDFTMNGGMVKENKTTGNHGGGIFLNGGNFSLRNGDILDNLSNSMGGGVYLYGGTFIMEDGNIAGNSSTSEGGGACIVNNGNFTMNDGNIVRNYSSLNGGGVYLDGGTLTVSAGTISNNASTANGGGLYIMNGTVTMGSGMIQENECGQYGGGVYVYNSSSNQKTVTFNGGTLSGNSAKYGGGVCVDGLILMTIGNVEIAENTATNGGGVCLMNSAYMEFGIGQIKNNTALTQTAFNTGFQKEIYEIEGFGGGVYLGSGTTLVFKSATELGLFGNHADNGGDEIFANGKNTKVDLPDVSKMALGGYPGASNLKWIEDYPTNDPNYDKGTKLKGNAWDTDKTNLRYRETISQNATIYNLSGATSDYERYICFALGYEIVYITITRYGLKHGESAIYHLRKNDANDFQVILTGNSEGTPITKKVAVTAGDWTVTETSWTWAYQSDARSITRAVPDPEPVDGIDRPFAFEGTRATTLPMNHEDIEVNVMGN